MGLAETRAKRTCYVVDVTGGARSSAISRKMCLGPLLAVREQHGRRVALACVSAVHVTFQRSPL